MCRPGSHTCGRSKVWQLVALKSQQLLRQRRVGLSGGHGSSGMLLQELVAVQQQLAGAPLPMSLLLPLCLCRVVLGCGLLQRVRLVLLDLPQGQCVRGWSGVGPVSSVVPTGSCRAATHTLLQPPGLDLWMKSSLTMMVSH